MSEKSKLIAKKAYKKMSGSWARVPGGGSEKSHQEVCWGKRR